MKTFPNVQKICRKARIASMCISLALTAMPGPASAGFDLVELEPPPSTTGESRQASMVQNRSEFDVILENCDYDQAMFFDRFLGSTGLLEQKKNHGYVEGKASWILILKKNNPDLLAEKIEQLRTVRASEAFRPYIKEQKGNRIIVSLSSSRHRPLGRKPRWRAAHDSGFD